MGKKNDKKNSNHKIDLSGFSDDEISSLYKASQRGVRRQGYDGSDDVTVDYTPSAQDAINANKVVSSDYKFGNWKKVREQVKGGYSEEDLISHMRGAVGREYLNRRDDKLAGMNARIDANANREFPTAEAAPAKEEQKTADAPPPKTTIDPITPRVAPKESDYGKDMPGWGDTEWNPEGGTKAPGEDEYNEMMAGQAKSRAQSYSGSKVDYSFNAGGGGTATPPSDANSGGTVGDVYGNVSPEDAAQGTLNKWKYGLTSAR